MKNADAFAKTAERIPYWLVATIGLGIFFLVKILTDEVYTVIFLALLKGVRVTVYVTIVAYIGAVFFGLLVGMARLSKSRVLQEVTSFYVEIVRGVPMLVLLYYIVFVGAPALVGVINWLGDAMLSIGLSGLGTAWTELSVRDLSFDACNFGPHHWL